MAADSDEEMFSMLDGGVEIVSSSDEDEDLTPPKEVRAKKLTAMNPIFYQLH